LYLAMGYADVTSKPGVSGTIYNSSLFNDEIIHYFTFRFSILSGAMNHLYSLIQTNG